MEGEGYVDAGREEEDEARVAEGGPEEGEEEAGGG